MYDINGQVAIDRHELYNNWQEIPLFRAYARGDQDTTLTKQQEAMLEGILGNDYCDNVAGQILEEHVGRLELTSVRVKTQKEQKWINDFWQKNSMDDNQDRVHNNALRDGNYCVMVEWDEDKERVVLHREPWFDGARGVFIGYDAYGNMLYAVKEWQTFEGVRRTIYYEGGIERYIKSGNAWLPFAMPGDPIDNNGTPGTIPYVDGNGKPMHIPFVHFANPGNEFENYGSSMFDGGIIGANDQINDVQYDMSAAGRQTGYQQYWGRGYKLKKDRHGKTIQPMMGPGMFHHAEEKEAQWGVFPAGSIDSLVKLYDKKLESLCRNTGTPVFVITGNWPSGDALRQAIKPIISRARKRIKRFSPKWAEVVHRAMEIANAFGDAGLDENELLQSVYSNPNDYDPLTTAMGASQFWQGAVFAVQSGLPLETYLEVMGWGEDVVKGISTDIAAEIQKRQAQLAQSDPNGPKPQPVGRSGTGAGPNAALRQVKTKVRQNAPR